MGQSEYWSAFMRRQVSRRRILQGGAVVGAGLWAGAALGCGSGQSGATPTAAGPASKTLPTTGPGSSTSPTAKAETPKPGGSLVRRDTADPRSFDFDLETTPNVTCYTTLVYNGLVKFNPDASKVVQDLSESVEQPDEVTYIFKLNKGVTFQNIAPLNGREFTAEDAKYSIERQITNNALFTHAYFFKDDLAKIEVVDKYTVKFTTNQPYAPFMNWMANAWTLMKPKELVDKNGDLKTAAIGTGPYILKDYKKGVEGVLVKNPDYFKKGKPYLDEIHTRYVPDSTTAVAMFVGGELDVAGIDVAIVAQTKKQKANATYLEGVESMFPLMLRTQPYDDTHPHKPPFDNKLVRQAIQYATDKQEYVNTVTDGNGVAMVGFIPPSRKPYALPESEQIKQDLAKAKQLLTQAGYPNGFKIEMVASTGSTTSVDSAQVAKGQLAKIGITVDIKLLEDAQYRNVTGAYDYMLNLHTTAGAPEPEYYFKTLFGQNASVFRWGNKELWAKVEAQSRIMDPQKRLQAILEVQRMLADDVPAVPLFVPTGTTGVQARVKGFTPAWNQYDFSWYEDVWVTA